MSFIGLINIYILTSISAIKPNKETEEIFEKIINALLPFLYSIACVALIFSIMKYSWKIYTDPEGKGEYIRYMVWSIIGCSIVLSAAGIAHIIFNKLISSV